MQYTTDTRALKFVRQFHRKRILRFAAGRQIREIENQEDLKRSQVIIAKITQLLGEDQ